jgi:hypothetical protein
MTVPLELSECHGPAGCSLAGGGLAQCLCRHTYQARAELLVAAVSSVDTIGISKPRSELYWLASRLVRRRSMLQGSDKRVGQIQK